MCAQEILLEGRKEGRKGRKEEVRKEKIYWVGKNLYSSLHLSQNLVDLYSKKGFKAKILHKRKKQSHWVEFQVPLREFFFWPEIWSSGRSIQAPMQEIPLRVPERPLQLLHGRGEGLHSNSWNMHLLQHAQRCCHTLPDSLDSSFHNNSQKH